MKRKLLILSAIAGLTIYSCTNNDEVTNVNNQMSEVNKSSTAKLTIMPNDANVSVLIKAIETSVLAIKANGGTNGIDLNNLALNSIESQGMGLLPIKAVKFTSEFESIEKDIFAEAINFATEDEYLTFLKDKYSEVISSKLEDNEKQLLVDTIYFQEQLVYLGQKLDAKFPTDKLVSKKGWWASWGKCVAGTLGGALTGGTLGCAGVGAVGGLVGSIAPGVGTAAGALGGCAIGGISGGIGGALTGAATFC